MEGTDEAKKKKRVQLLIFGSIAGLIIIVLIAIFSIATENINNVTLNVRVTPGDATILINDKEYSNGEYRVTPGDYKVVVSKDGFDTHEDTYAAKRGETVDILVRLEQSDGGNDWYLDNPDDDKLYTEISDRKAQKDQREFAERFPIMNHVPYTDAEKYASGQAMNRFKIDAVYQEDQLSLLVTLNTCSDYSANIYKQDALDWIRSKDIDPNDYIINYKTLCD